MRLASSDPRLLERIAIRVLKKHQGTTHFARSPGTRDITLFRMLTPCSVSAYV